MGMLAIAIQSPPSTRAGKSEPSSLKEKPRTLRSAQANTVTARDGCMAASQNSWARAKGTRDYVGAPRGLAKRGRLPRWPLKGSLGDEAYMALTPRLR